MRCPCGADPSVPRAERNREVCMVEWGVGGVGRRQHGGSSPSISYL